MARRAGKAASRKARQRNVRRPAMPAATPIPPIGTPDAREAASLTPPRRTISAAPTAGSNLTERERAEYHYVERDLRSIGLLTVVMVALLVVAYVVFSSLGMVG